MFHKIFVVFFVMSCLLFNFTYANPPIDTGENITAEQAVETVKDGVEGVKVLVFNSDSQIPEADKNKILSFIF